MPGSSSSDPSRSATAIDTSFCHSVAARQGDVFEQGLCAGFGKGRIINGTVQFQHLDAGAEAGLQSVEERLIGHWIVKFLSGRANHADGLTWNQNRHRTRGTIYLLGDNLAEARALLRRGAH